MWACFKHMAAYCDLSCMQLARRSASGAPSSIIGSLPAEDDPWGRIAADCQRQPASHHPEVWWHKGAGGKESGISKIALFTVSISSQEGGGGLSVLKGIV
jgi:hypothetical protein